MAGGRPVFVSLKPVRMLAAVCGAEGCKGCAVFWCPRWERREEVKETISPGGGERCPEPQKRKGGDGCLGRRVNP